MSNTVRVAAPVTLNSIVDGPGMRSVVWFQGCPHACPGCHNPATHAFDGGVVTTIEDIIDEVAKQPWRGVTISGGEPFMQAEALLKLVKGLHALGKTLWIYTGFTIEGLIASVPLAREILTYADTLVDGPYLQECRDPSLAFRGSTNQRLVDLKEFFDSEAI